MRRLSVLCVLAFLVLASPVLGQGTLIPNASFPVVGSSGGALGSFFRTAFQLSNITGVPIDVRLVFRPAGTPATLSDPTYVLHLGPRETRSYTDIVETMGQTGLGSLDLYVDNVEGVPQIVTRVYNDAGPAGTTGFTEPVVLSYYHGLDTLNRIDYLLVPGDPDRYRFNIGIRTYSCPIFFPTSSDCAALYPSVDLLINVFDASGNLVRTLQKHFPNDLFLQQPAADFLEGPIGPNYSIQIFSGNGLAVMYGATADNTTQDSSAQFTKILAPVP